MDKQKIEISPEHARFLSGLRRRKGFVIAMRVLLLAVLIALWEVLAVLGLIDTFIMSSPSRIINTVEDLFVNGNVIYHSLITLWETLAGFALSTVIGTAIAVILWAIPLLRKILDPYIVVLNSLPKIALGPVIIIWFGAGSKSIIAMAVLICVIITILNMLAAFQSCEKEKILLLKSMGATKLQVLLKLVLPHSLPAFISVLKINVGMAWVGAIMGEYLVSKAGLGYLIIYGGVVFKLDLVMACTIILCALAAGMYFAVVLLEKIVMKRRYNR